MFRRFTNENVPNPLALLNEWRDTVLLTVVVVGVGVGVIPIKRAYLVFVLRELVRYVAWLCSQPMQIVGGVRSPKSIDVLNAVSILINLLGVVCDVLDHSWYWLLLPAISLMVCTLVTTLQSGLKRAVDAYICAWDWPRKGDGPSETSKLRNWLPKPAGAAVSAS